MATEIKNTTVKPKSSAPDGSSKGKKDSSAVKKRVESASTKSGVQITLQHLQCESLNF